MLIFTMTKTKLKKVIFLLFNLKAINATYFVNEQNMLSYENCGFALVFEPSKFEQVEIGKCECAPQGNCKSIKFYPYSSGYGNKCKSINQLSKNTEIAEKDYAVENEYGFFVYSKHGDNKALFFDKSEEFKIVKKNQSSHLKTLFNVKRKNGIWQISHTTGEVVCSDITMNNVYDFMQKLNEDGTKLYDILVTFKSNKESKKEIVPIMSNFMEPLMLAAEILEKRWQKDLKI